MSVKRLVTGWMMLSILALGAQAIAAPRAPTTVEVWGVFDLPLDGPRTGNPFVDVELAAELTNGDRRVTVRGFYDGDGLFRVRFMPDRQGTWRYVTRSNVRALDGKSGTFRATPPRAGNRGPVRVKDKFHFAYADGTQYLPFGTTIYALAHQPIALQEQTLGTLAKAPFNKLRLCVLPKWYPHNRKEPPLYPFERGADGKFDLSRPNLAFYRLFDKRLADLGKLGIQADVILFHPYDEGHWGFDRMGREADERYLRYVLARFGAFRNVWWSMANEWDLVKTRPLEDWARLFDIVKKDDAHGRLVSIHNAGKNYDQANPTITHVSLQGPDMSKFGELRTKFGKPVINDECEYEGDIESPWGSITGRELVYRHWAGFLKGGYVGHGETFLHPSEVLWWSHGGVLRGESPPRIAFLRKIIEKTGPLDPISGWPFDHMAAGRTGNTFLFFFGPHQTKVLTELTTGRFVQKDTTLKDARWTFEMIDPWEMTTTRLPGEHQGKFRLDLPGKPYQVLRLTATPPKTAAAAPAPRGPAPAR